MNSNKQPIVFITKNTNIHEAVIKTLENIELPDLNGKTILLKPNVGREAEEKTAINTNPEVVSAVFEFLNKKFESRILIGDSPIISTVSRSAFEKSGYSNLLSNPNLEYIDLDEKPPITLNIPEGKILKKIRVSGYWPEIDYIVSIPVLKMHMHTGASISFKNMKGTIYKRDKIKLHHLTDTELKNKLQNKKNTLKELDIAISDLAYVLKPDLAIIDASIVQEGMGPSSGNPRNMDMIIASNNFLAADIVALKIIQPTWDLDNVPHLKLIKEIMYPEIMEDDLSIITVPEALDTLIEEIEPPPQSITIKYNNVNLVDIDSCSACLSTIFSFLKENKDFISKHFSEEKPLNLGIGKGIKQSDIYEPIFLVGNCTLNQKENGIMIKGCTPVSSKILSTIKDYYKIE